MEEPVEELDKLGKILRRRVVEPLSSEKQEELILKGVLATLEEHAMQTGGSSVASQLLYETAATYPDESIRRHAFRSLTRLAQEGNPEDVDFIFLLAVENDLLAARQLIVSKKWEPSCEELRALFDWITNLASGRPFPAEYLPQITRAYLHTASKNLQQRLLASAETVGMKNWARIVSAVQDRHGHEMQQLVEEYSSFRDYERRLTIEQLDQRAQEGSFAAQDALCQLFTKYDDLEAKRIALERGYAPTDIEQRALFLFLSADWQAYSKLDFDRNLMTNIYEAAERPLRRRLMEHSRKYGQTEWLRGLGPAGEVRWPNELTDSDWELAIKRLLEGQKKEDLWRLSQTAPPTWSAMILDLLAKSGWIPEDEEARVGFTRLSQLASACRQNPLTIRPNKSLHTSAADITCLAIHPDGQLLAIGSSEPRITLLNLPDGDQQPESLLMPAPVTRALVISPDGELIACASNDNRIRVFHIQKRQMVKSLEGHRAMIRSLAVHPNGRMLFSAGFDGEIRYWRFPFGPEIKTLQPNGGEIFSLALGNAGKVLFSGGTDGQVRVWTVPEGSLVRQIQSHTVASTHLAASFGSEMVASVGSDGKICIWNSNSGSLVRSMQNQSGPVTCLSLHPNEQVLISGHQNGVINLWNISSGKTFDPLLKHQEAITGLALTQDGAMLYSSDTGGTLLAWDLRTFLSTRLASYISRPGTLISLQERLKHPQLTASERTWLTFCFEMARWGQRFEIELSNSAPIQTGEFDIELL